MAIAEIEVRDSQFQHVGTNAEESWIRSAPDIDPGEPYLRTPPAVSVAYTIAKRVTDIVVSAGLLLFLSPLLLCIACAIRLGDGGPALFRQRRVGKCGREFWFYKFRSMVIDAEQKRRSLATLNRHTDPRTFKVHNDPRVTRLGSWLRRSSLDELPQLWNVVRGEMSLVGPRPPIPEEVELYTGRDWQRFFVKPGITGLWQVSGRSSLSFPEQMKLDCEYIRRQGVLLDFALIARTIPAVLSGRGAD